MQGEKRRDVSAMARYAQYPPLGFSVVPQKLISELNARRVGRNGLFVMMDLCRQTYEDGALGIAPARDVSQRTGLTAYQVARGMAELRDKGIIEPVTVRGRDGIKRPDRSTHGHVARYRIAHDVWDGVQLDSAPRP
jgi:hypothetical protein